MLCSVNTCGALMVLTIASTPLSGCATSEPPRELVAARDAYRKAQASHASELSPASLSSAKVALDGAEKSWQDDGKSLEARNQAYIALRKSQLAQTDASAAYYQQQLAQRNRRDAQAAAAAESRQELAAAQQKLAAESRERAQAEQSDNALITKLASIDSVEVSRGARGTVITLPDGALFKTDQSDLQAGSREDLATIADALRSQQNAKILVEGHTDSRGTSQHNLQLSEARAESVARFLSSRGVSSDQLTVQGIGEGRPIADNSTAEGRAQNRRVEIVVQRTEP
jgi:outer membrane protein OmpA-like peptidoglycan-associated protein